MLYRSKSTVLLPQSSVFVAGDIQNHSSDERYFIMATDRQTKLGRELFEKWLNNANIGFKPLIGRFENQKEYSYIFNVRHWVGVRDSGFVTRQKYALYLTSYGVKYGVEAREAILYDLRSGEAKPLGAFVAINDSELDQYKNWSFDISDDRYYVVKTKEQLNV